MCANIEKNEEKREEGVEGSGRGEVSVLCSIQVVALEILDYVWGLLQSVVVYVLQCVAGYCSVLHCCSVLWWH